MGLYLRMGHISRRWGLAQLVCLGIILAVAIIFAAKGQHAFTGKLGYLALTAFIGFVALSFLSKRENDRDQRPSI